MLCPSWVVVLTLTPGTARPFASSTVPTMSAHGAREPAAATSPQPATKAISVLFMLFTPLEMLAGQYYIPTLGSLHTDSRQSKQ
jgi:hypothetical protein